MSVVDLGDGLTERPLTAGDATAVFEVIAAQELADLGVVEIEEADIVGDWQRPSFDVSSGTVGIFDGDRLVAYAEVAGDRGDAAVDPAYRGRGIGTALAAWTQAKAHSNGATEVGMPVPEGSPGDRLLDALGYRVRWTSWVLKLPEGRTIEARTLPAGYIIREAAVAEYRDVWIVVEDAFLEWSRRERESFEDFAATVTERPGFEPWNLRVVVDPTGAVVGVSFVLLDGSAEAYVSKLAVRRDQRGRGLAQALLVDSFAQARAHGAKVSGLATDSRTGALGLYTKVGMEPTSVWVNRGIAL
jgi:GNAT superfamily N-acetyltransferase